MKGLRECMIAMKFSIMRKKCGGSIHTRQRQSQRREREYKGMPNKF